MNITGTQYMVDLFVLNTHRWYMVIAEIRAVHMGDWRGQLRESDTGEKMGEEWHADQRGALIGLMKNWLPLTHIHFKDVPSPAFD